MAEHAKLPIPPALYDYVLFYECATKDWKSKNIKLNVDGTGNSLSMIKWDTTASIHENDAGGATKCGITTRTWASYAKNHGHNTDVNLITQEQWVEFIGNWWNNVSYAAYCNGYACAFQLFQMVWGGFGSKSAKSLIQVLKENADIKDYPFIKSNSFLRTIADATHAFTDPMVAFKYMQMSKFNYLFSISTPDYINSKGKKNDVFRHGWFNRNALGITFHGLYANLSASGKRIGWTYDTPTSQWHSIVQNHIANGASGMKKLFDWGVDPENIQDLIQSDLGAYDPSLYNNNYSNSNYLSSGISQLGDYSNYANSNIIFQHYQNREDVLQTLVGGSYMPDEIKPCEELISSDKKKNVKIKSEN